MEAVGKGERPEPDGGSTAVRAAAVAAAVIALVHFGALLGVAGPADDDYIVWRYARNWVEHGVYAFNGVPGVGGPGDLSDGVTTPLWFLVCAVFVRLGVAPEVATPAVGAVAFAGLAATVALAAGASGRRLGLRPAACARLAGALVALNPALAWHAWAGLGTLPAAWAVALGGRAWVRGRPAAAGLALAVATGFRPEVAPVAVGLAAGAARGEVLRTLRVVALPSIAVFVLLAGARQLAFGTWLPATARIKALPLTDELAYGAAYVARSFQEGGLALLLGLAVAALFQRDSVLRGLGRAALVALGLVLVVGGDWMVFGRFFVPWTAFAVLGAIVTLARLGPGLRRALAVALFAVTLVGGSAYPGAIRERRAYERWWLRVGDFLDERTADVGERLGRTPTVALSPIGAIGWRSGWTVVDVLGLTHGAFLDRAPALDTVAVKGHHRFDGAWILDQAPDYLILGNGVLQPGPVPVAINPWEADLVRDARFERDYVRELARVPVAGGETAALPYARRRGAPAL